MCICGTILVLLPVNLKGGQCSVALNNFKGKVINGGLSSKALMSALIKLLEQYRC